MPGQYILSIHGLSVIVDVRISCLKQEDVPSMLDHQSVGLKGIGYVKRNLITIVGGFNPIEKYQSKWDSSQNRDEKLKVIETTT